MLVDKLPDELLLLVLFAAQTQDLLSVSFACRRLRDVGLPEYLKRFGINGSPHHVFITDDDKFAALPALRVLHPSHSYSHVDFAISNENTLRKLAGAEGLICSAARVDVVSIRFPSLPPWQDTDPFVCALQNLLGALTTKHVSIIELEECDRNASLSRLPSAPHSPLRGLTKLAIRGYIYLFPPFLDWTIACMNSSPLVELIIDTFLGSQRWSALLPRLTLPHLRIVQFGTAAIDANRLIAFVQRHPALRSLRLKYGSSPDCQATSVPTQLLPQLEVLEAWPACIADLLRHPDSAPTLRELMICHTWETSVLNVVGGAIVETTRTGLFRSALACLEHREGIVALSIGFSADGSSVFTVDPRARATRVETRLVCVEVLVITAWPFSNVVLALLPDWLGLFPALSRVDFTACPTLDEQESTRLVAAVAAACPGLALFRLGTAVYDMKCSKSGEIAEPRQQDAAPLESVVW